MPARFDLSARAKLRLTGSDRVRFLNGQVTNDVRKANAQLALLACVLSVKGKMDALIFIAGNDANLLLDTAAELQEKLPQRLERYVIADDVTVEDVTDDFALFHVLGEQPPILPNESTWRRSKRFGLPGWDLWIHAGARERVRAELSASGEFYDEEAAERFRIEQGIPRWGRELSDEIIPVEANLESDAIDYEKGCYMGQEIISRMKMSGQTNKRLSGIISTHDAPLRAGMKLVTMSEEGKEVGRLTSATRSARFGRELALGFVKRGFNAPGTQLDALDATAPHSSAATRVHVVALPFRLDED